MPKVSKKVTDKSSQVRRVSSVNDMAEISVVKSAERVLRILEYFDDVQRDARVTEIAKHLGLPQSSASVLLKSLTQLGYLDYDLDRRSFCPTARVTLLGAWLNEGSLFNGKLLRMLEEVSKLTCDTVILAMRNGIYSQYVHVIQATTTIRYHVPPNARRLLVWSGTGFALLSQSPESEIRALVARTNSEMFKSKKHIDSRAVIASVRQSRLAGYFVSHELVSRGAGALAMPLPQARGSRTRRMAICVASVLGRIEQRERELVLLLQDTIRRHLLVRDQHG
jgi:DNA-binding IclR family transcriptional regulator